MDETNSNESYFPKAEAQYAAEYQMVDLTVEDEGRKLFIGTSEGAIEIWGLLNVSSSEFPTNVTMNYALQKGATVLVWQTPKIPVGKEFDLEEDPFELVARNNEWTSDTTRSKPLQDGNLILLHPTGEAE
eukprot:scaffold2445_cov205-Alexandrium_tamarense.AAC.12